jgi:hypothetical protein
VRPSTSSSAARATRSSTEARTTSVGGGGYDFTRVRELTNEEAEYVRSLPIRQLKTILHDQKVRRIENRHLALWAVLYISPEPEPSKKLCSRMQCGDSGCIEKSDLIDRVLLCMSSQGV